MKSKNSHPKLLHILSYLECFGLEFRSCIVLFSLLASSITAQAASPADGITFLCTSPVKGKNSHSITTYLASKGIPSSWLTISSISQRLNIKIKPSMQSGSTLGISADKRFGVSSDFVLLIDPERAAKQVPTVSQKEVLLALLHNGRSTTYKGKDCGLEELKDDVGVRQITVAWAQNVAFRWPDGTPAEWESQYWEEGTPKAGVNLYDALTDALINSSSYAVGCYTAAKIILAASQLDYYQRIKHNSKQAQSVYDALMADNDPLINIEPGQAWYFEQDYPKENDTIVGKILNMKRGVAPRNFVPGDWLYMLNPDPESYAKTGYEGSNAIYLGMNNFSDYYNDHEHSYRLEQKMHEVYQWRHGVFSRTRDAKKVVSIPSEKMEILANTPSNGGLILGHRLVPRPISEGLEQGPSY